jgi:hypothetical protein
MQILLDLGNQDGDVDAAGQHWGANLSQMVADMFLRMPEAATVPADRRSTARRLREVYLPDHLILRDQSATGACLMVAGDGPVPGANFEFESDGALRRGTVRWVQRLPGGGAQFGVESSDAQGRLRATS